MSTGSARGKIVVGIDGSRESAEALAWALAEARLHALQMQVIYAIPVLRSYATGAISPEYYPQVKKEAEEVFERALEQLPEHGDVDIERILVPGNPAGQLVEASRGAAMLVVGARGLGGFRGMLLGSVSVQLVHHAHCPVVVVRDHAAGPRD